MKFNSFSVIKKNNDGMSLVELIVVIAIMAVLIGTIGFSMSLLSGAEARQGANKMLAQLNDIKTGTMTKADEDMVVRYIEVNDSNKDELALKGIDKSGYYAEKCSYTILNMADSNELDEKKEISKPIGDPEYAYICAKKVTISAVYAGTTYVLDGTDLTKAFMISFNRKTGEMDSLIIGTITGSNFDGTDFSASNTDAGEITAFTFECGLRTVARGSAYELEVTPATGRVTLK